MCSNHELGLDTSCRHNFGDNEHSGQVPHNFSIMLQKLKYFPYFQWKCRKKYWICLLSDYSALSKDGYCLRGQTLIVREVDNAIHRINHYPTDKCWQNKHAIHWIVIYPMYSVIHFSNNQGLQVTAEYASIARFIRLGSHPDNNQNMTHLGGTVDSWVKFQPASHTHNSLPQGSEYNFWHNGTTFRVTLKSIMV